MSWRRGLCLLAAALMISPAAVFVLPVQGDLSDPGSLSGCANITINGDAQFTSANGVVSGDGSPGNPYILENHSISVPWSRNGISITGTSKYFIIRNCFIYGTDTTLSWGAGINLASANNGSVHHNRIISNYAGVQLQGASNIDIHDNNITLNDYGIMLSGQGVNNVVHDNDVHNNTKIGIYPTGTSNQIIKQNNVHHNLLGIGISNSPNIRLFNNTMWANNYSFAPYENASEDYPANNSMDGKPLRWVKDMVDWTFNLTAGYIGLVNCTNVTVQDFSMSRCSAGVLVLDSRNITIQNMTMEGNQAGVRAVGTSSNGTITKCTFRGNSDGVLLGGSSHHMLVEDNDFSDNDNGVMITEEAVNQTVRSNGLFRNKQGIAIYYGAYYYDQTDGCNLIINNTISDSADHGILLSAAWKNQLMNNSVFNGSKYGIRLLKSTNNDLSGNSMWGNAYNIGMINDHDIDHTGRLFDNNISSSNTVNGKKIYFWVGRSKATVPLDAGYVALINCSQITVKDITMSKNGEGMIAYQSAQTLIENVTITDTGCGILMIQDCDKTKVRNCTLKNGSAIDADMDAMGDGIYLSGSDDPQIKNCSIDDFEGCGIRVLSHGIGTIGGVVSGNRLSSNNGTAIHVQAHPSATVAYNVVSDNPGGGIYIGYESSVLVTNNIIARGGNAITIGNTISASTISNNTLSEGYYYGIWTESYGPTNTLIKNNTVSGMNHGIEIDVPKSSNLVNNIVHNCSVGISINNPTTFTMSGNIMRDNQYNLDVWGDNTGLNSMSLSTDNTVDGKPVYLWKSQNNRVVPTDAGMVILVSCSRITAKDLVLAHTDIGILMSNTDDCLIQNVSLKDMYWSGIYLQDASDGNAINDSLFQTMHYRGIEIDSGDRTQIHNNTFLESGVGVQLNINVRNGTTIFNNCFSDNDDAIHFCGGAKTNTTINDNVLYANRNGFYGPVPDGVICYNNYLWNDFNIYPGYTVKGIWNRTKVAGTNIVGGPNLGGNFWNNYTGSDNDSDGLGDTDVPFGPGDHLPLMMGSDAEAPSVTDMTSGSPTTGDDFTFRAHARDDIRLGGVVVEYWANGLEYYNLSLARRSGNDTDGYFELTIPMQANATSLTYRLAAWDLRGNWNTTTNRTLAVMDNDAPTIEDRSAYDIPTTGDPFILKAAVSDNVALSCVTVEHWQDSGPHTNVTLAGPAGIFSNSINISSNASVLHYFFWAKDSSNNTRLQPRVDMPVKDNDPPAMADLTAGTPRTDRNFTVNCSAADPRDIQHMTLSYWYDSDSTTDVGVDPNAGGFYEHDITMQDTAWTLNYFFTGHDAAGNRNSTPEKNLPISDMTRPEIEDTTGTIHNGAVVNITADVTDNHAVDRVSADYWFDSGAHTNVSLTGPPYNSSGVSVPIGAATMSYVLRANDTSGNIRTLRVDRPIVDSIMPSITDKTTGSPETGQMFGIGFNVTDNRGVGSVFLDHWFDSGPHNNSSLAGTPEYGKTILVGRSCLMLSYVIWANDTQGNVNMTRADLPVRDVLDPIMVDRTNDTPQTGQPFTLACIVDENIGLDHVSAEYWFDGRPHNTSAMTGNSTYELKIDIPAESTTLNYTFWAVDVNGNFVCITSYKKVQDIISPVIADATGEPTTGDGFNISFTATDNRGIDLCVVEYWFDGAGHCLVPFETEIMVMVPSNATTMHYIISAQDTSGNNASARFDRPVRDNDPPQIEDTSETPSSGSSFWINVTISDNRGLLESRLVFSIDDGDAANISFDGSAQISIPNNARTLRYTVRATDTSGLWAEMSKSRAITDIIPPSIVTWEVHPSTGAGFDLSIDISDNRDGIDSIVEYWFDVSAERTKETSTAAGERSYHIMAPSNSRAFFYRISATDAAGLTSTIENTTAVRDVLKPQIEDRTGEPTTGSELGLDISVGDNIGVNRTTVEYWFDNGPHRTLTYETGIKIPVPVDALKMGYVVEATDAAGNTVQTDVQKNVTDVLFPVISSVKAEKDADGGNLTVTVKASDNIGIRSVTIRISQGGAARTLDISLISNNTYSIVVTVDKAVKGSYNVTVTDDAGHDSQEFGDFSGTGTRPHPGIGPSGAAVWMYAAAIVAAVAVAAMAMSISRRKKK